MDRPISGEAAPLLRLGTLGWSEGFEGSTFFPMICPESGG